MMHFVFRIWAIFKGVKNIKILYSIQLENAGLEKQKSATVSISWNFMDMQGAN